jgi:hypothetical protein
LKEISVNAIVLGRKLGRAAVADYTEEKTFAVHQGERANGRPPRG